MNIGAPEAIIALVIILVLFGGSQLPKLAKNLGKAQKEFKDGLAEGTKSAETPADHKIADPKVADPKISE
jgi:sec-independent protein translocase protein TatA